MMTKDKNSENAPQLEITEVVLVYCNIVNNQYHRDSNVLFTFVSNKSFSQLLNISSKNYIYSEIFYSKFSYIDVSFTDQSSAPLDIEDRVNLTLANNEKVI